MNKPSWIFIGLILLVLPLAGLSCNWGNRGTPSDGGVFRSDDGGSTWQQKVFVAQEKKKIITIANVNIKSLIFFQAESGLLAANGGEAGLFLTTDDGEHWRKVFNSTVSAFAFHPRQAGVIYVASSNRIYRSQDSGVNWSNIYVDTTPDVQITDMSIDLSVDRIMYAATSRGVLLRSADSGNTWQQVYIFKGDIAKIMVSPRDNKILYISQSDGRIWRSYDSGSTWNDLSSSIKEQTGVRLGRHQSLVWVKVNADDLLYATQYGLFLGSDGGQKWRELKLVTPPGSVAITALTVNPQKSNHIIYTTATSLYYSSDSGATWQTKLLPSRRSASAVVINPYNPNQIYLGFSRK